MLICSGRVRKHIKHLRTHWRMTTAQIANRAGVSYVSVASIASGSQRKVRSGIAESIMGVSAPEKVDYRKMIQSLSLLGYSGVKLQRRFGIGRKTLTRMKAAGHKPWSRNRNLIETLYRRAPSA